MARYAFQRRSPTPASFRLRGGPQTYRSSDLKHLYRGAKSSRAIKDIYASDHTDGSAGGRFRWLVSTCLAGAVGALAIIVVAYGSVDPKDTTGGLLPTLRRIGEDVTNTPVAAMVHKDDGLKWAVPRTDRLEVNSRAMSTRYLIHETLKQKRSGREYIYAKPYVRIVLRLAPVPPGYEDVIPPFNPFKLYGNNLPFWAAFCLVKMVKNSNRTRLPRSSRSRAKWKPHRRPRRQLQSRALKPRRNPARRPKPLSSPTQRCS
jgi:hypothetical protein